MSGNTYGGQPVAVQNDTANGNKPNSNERELICYSCGGPGHIAKFCEAIQKHMQLVANASQSASAGSSNMTATSTPNQSTETGKLVDISDNQPSTETVQENANWSAPSAEYLPLTNQDGVSDHSGNF